MREEVGATRGADVYALDGFDAGLAQDPLRRGPEVEVAAAQHVVAEAVAIRTGDVVADLVAARPDPRTDRGRETLASEGRDAGLDDSFEQSHPSRVKQGERRTPCRTRERDRETVRRQLQHRHTRVVGPQPVPLPA